MSTEVNSKRCEQLKTALFDLQAQRKKIEDEIVMHKVVLETNKVGMKDSLTDAEDFPRNDIDVFAVRHARAAINKLEYDIKELMNQMQARLEELHSLSRPPQSAGD
ncbi:MAG: hypothetical protein EOO38_12295 [Cytophagaceae bacterium]|nr:MAG: hypothetical protein EOO38_12295 [Cytophagaceae bacterium]